MYNIRSRQVHLDFHNSELMPDIGKQFDKKNFQQALQLGNVNSVTVFAKCHHSWCYYPTEVGKMHPTLNFDLTGAMIDAAHEIGVKAPIYITVGWSSNDATEHPEWTIVKEDGTLFTNCYDFNAKEEEVKPLTSWIELCANGNYGELILSQTQEICDRYPVVDGLFYDICFRAVCYCQTCKDGMRKLGLDPSKREDAEAYSVKCGQDFMSRCKYILKEKHPAATIFFNGGADPYQPQWHVGQTHFEMEDLPTAWEGYDKMPPRAKFFARSGKHYVGQTGKFHTFWGEFGGFKTPAALTYECAAMSAYGARCSVGDQLHPCGEMDIETYRTIGDAYRYVESIEEWCYDATETTKLGIYLSKNSNSDQGLQRMLLEKQLDFDIVHDEDELSRFNTLILPDCVLLKQKNVQKLIDFLTNGGKVLFTGTSGLNADKTEFLFDVGAKYLGQSDYKNDYVKASKVVAEGIVRTPFLFYESANKVEIIDSEILASIYEPYFDRTYGHYSSHQNTPYKLKSAAYPAAIRKNNVVYLAHPICEIYFKYGAQYHRDYFINALRLLYTDPILQVELPSAGRARFVNQKINNRYVLHLLYASPIQRGTVQVIEDIPPLYDIETNVSVEEKITRVYLAPQKENIPFIQENGYVKIKIPKIKGHQIVVLDY